MLVVLHGNTISESARRCRLLLRRRVTIPNTTIDAMTYRCQLLGTKAAAALPLQCCSAQAAVPRCRVAAYLGDTVMLACKDQVECK